MRDSLPGISWRVQAGNEGVNRAGNLARFPAGYQLEGAGWVSNVVVKKKVMCQVCLLIDHIIMFRVVWLCMYVYFEGRLQSPMVTCGGYYIAN